MTSTGPSLPSDIRFQSFSRQTPQGSELLIHSSDHPTIDYTAAEGAELGENHLKHYLAVFDPAENTLKLAEATKLTVRGSVRQEKFLQDDGDEDTANFIASQNTRSALTEAFGSKRSKKAVQSMAENRQLGQGVEGASIADAIGSNMIDEEGEEELADPSTASRIAKPLPAANMTTDDIEEVYSLSSLIFPRPASATLQDMDIGPWKARLNAGKEISVRTRYVANRVGYIGKRVIQEGSAKFVQQLQLLRYIELLVEIAQYCGRQDRRRKMEFVDKWPEGSLSPGVSTSTIKQVVKHFFPENMASERAMTLLHTTIFALTLHIVPPSGKTGPGKLITEPTDIQLDLALEAAAVVKLFRELGCKVAPAPDRDLAVWGYQRLAEKQKRKAKEGETKVPKLNFVTLQFPLNFPKMSQGRRRR